MISYTLNQLWLLRKARTRRDPQGQRVLLLQHCILCKDLSSEGVGDWFFGFLVLELIKGGGKLPQPQHQTVFFIKCFHKQFYQPQKCHQFLKKLQVNCFFLTTLVCSNDLQGAREHSAASLAASLLVCLSNSLRDVYPARQSGQIDAKLELLARCMRNTSAVPAQGSSGCKISPSRGDSPLLSSLLELDCCRSLHLQAGRCCGYAWLQGHVQLRLEFRGPLAHAVPRRGLGLCWKRV